jgi:hypothetical protein
VNQYILISLAVVFGLLIWWSLLAISALKKQTKESPAKREMDHKMGKFSDIEANHQILLFYEKNILNNTKRKREL